jgi:hypothetical protein
MLANEHDGIGNAGGAAIVVVVVIESSFVPDSHAARQFAARAADIPMIRIRRLRCMVRTGCAVDRNPLGMGALMVKWHRFFDYDNDNDNDNEKNSDRKGASGAGPEPRPRP